MPTTLSTLRDRHDGRMATPIRSRDSAALIPDTASADVVDLFVVTTDPDTGAITQQDVYVPGFHQPDDPNVLVVEPDRSFGAE